MGWVIDDTNDGVIHSDSNTIEFIPFIIDTVWSFNNYFKDEPPQSTNIQFDVYTEFNPKNTRVFISNEKLDCSLNREFPAVFIPKTEFIFILHRESNVVVRDISMKKAKFSDRLNNRIFSTTNDTIVHLTIPADWHLGAFRDGKMKKITIPKSCKKIADYAFYNTKIKSVKISRDCEYYENSFPPECEIKFYDD